MRIDTQLLLVAGLSLFTFFKPEIVQSVYRSDREEEEYIADINKNWYIHARTALCCFHNIVLLPLYSNKIYLYKP